MSVILASDDSRVQLNSLWQQPHYDRRKSMGIVNRRHLGVGGRRSSVNSSAGVSNAYVDIYDKPLAITAIFLVLLSAVDAAFTQILVGAGAQELNGVVNYLLNSASSVFIPIKIGVTGLAAIFLMIHHNFIVFRIVRVRNALNVLVMAYAAVVLYEMYLFAFLMK